MLHEDVEFGVEVKAALIRACRAKREGAILGERELRVHPAAAHSVDAPTGRGYAGE
jgi:hypothetical protein